MLKADKVAVIQKKPPASNNPTRTYQLGRSSRGKRITLTAKACQQLKPKAKLKIVVAIVNKVVGFSSDNIVRPNKA